MVGCFLWGGGYLGIGIGGCGVAETVVGGGGVGGMEEKRFLPAGREEDNATITIWKLFCWWGLKSEREGTHNVSRFSCTDIFLSSTHSVIHVTCATLWAWF